MTPQQWMQQDEQQQINHIQIQNKCNNKKKKRKRKYPENDQRGSIHQYLVPKIKKAKINNNQRQNEQKEEKQQFENYDECNMYILAQQQLLN